MEYEILDNTLANWGIALLYVVGAIVIVRLLSMLGRRVVEPFVKRSGNWLDNVVYYSLDSPAKFAIILLGFWLAIHRLVYPDSFVRVVDNTYRILIILDITWVFARLTSGLIQRYRLRDRQTRRMIPVVRRAALVLVWLVGLVTALSNIGVNISALLGTLGIGGIAFALAAQDTVKNVFGAFTIFTDKPFRIGDTIRVDNVEGTVVDVGMRSTRILNYDKRMVTIPNYRLMEAVIVNISLEPMHRVTVKLGLEYTTSPKKMNQALDILRNIPLQVSGLSDVPADTNVNFTEFADSSLIITCYYFIRKGENVLGVTSEMNIAILTNLSSAGLRFAYPTRTLHICSEELNHAAEKTREIEYVERL